MKAEELFIGGYYRHRYKEYGSTEESVHDFKVSQIPEHDGRLFVWCKESGCVCTVNQVEPIELTTDLLEKAGWFTKDNIIWVKKGPLRLGWQPRNKSLITGYYTFPQAVRFVHELQAIQRLLGLEEIKL